MEDYYSVLDCKPSDTLEEIKRKYQELILKYHPDKNNIAQVDDDRDFLLINKAWNVLKESESREKYDATMKRLQIDSQPPIYEVLTIQQLVQNKEDEFYSYLCRCGGQYIVNQSDVTSPECIVSCDDCSFCILIKS